ncbi:MAG: prephenate dehydratase [Candidatus Omnitrophota bacterium]|nr:prephenate dehydratase [Candidatus Omnitrophota bacterium]
MKLNKLREKIDFIDNGILSLLNQRAKEVIEVNKLKKRNNIDTYSPKREEDILNRLKKMNKGPLGLENIEVIFREIFSIYRSLNGVLQVVYLGPQGTFTHLAAMKKFGKGSKYIPAESISEVFDKVEKEEVNYGVVPIENSIEGVVSYTVDMFFDSQLKICSEITMNISHVLLGTSLKKIKRIYSKSEVFAQCRKWISRYLTGVELVSTSSTAKAAVVAKKDRYGACIGNKILAELYGLKILASSIEDSSSNITRFLIIGKNDSGSSGSDKTSLLCSVKDRVGALYDVLLPFKKYRINLTKIESRPSKKKPWEYYFFIDFEGHRDSLKVQKALRCLAKECIFVKILGSYPKES